MKNKTVPIIFHAGTYGTYLEWILYSISTSIPIIEPFTDARNSHNFKGYHLSSINGWRNYLNTSNDYSFVRLHPKTCREDSIFDHFVELGKDVDHFVYIYPDENTLLLCLANQYSKIWDSWWRQQFVSHEINPNMIYDNWPVDKNTRIEDIPIWIQREFLSFYMMPMWLDQIEWGNQKQFSHPKCILLTVSELLFSFNESIKQLSKKLNLTLTKTLTDIMPYHDKMLTLQKNIGIDQLCKNIIESIIQNYSFSWQPLSMVGEAWIQWQLRNLGYEIRCHGLDIFPTNSVQLQELLYKA